MTETDLSPRVRALLPRGFADRDMSDIAAAEAMMAKIREVYALYGFEAVETPFVEYTEALGKFLPDQDRPNEGVFSFRDDDEWLSLRYDLTAPLARYVAENYEKLPKPYRSYRAGWVFRNEKPGPGRFRQFMQFDADTVGTGNDKYSGPAADAEICMMAADVMKEVGIQPGDYVVKVNSRRILDGIMEAIGLGGDDNTGLRLTVLRAVDKLDRLGPDGVRALLGSGRKDESGDFTQGAGLDEPKADLVISCLTASGHDGKEKLKEVARYVNRYTREPSRFLAKGIEELTSLLLMCETAGFSQDRIVFDPSVVRGLEYYTGPVLEAELTFEIPGAEGRAIRFGSVGGGGRYDGLIARFRGEPVPATGFSIGVSRLLAALRAIKSPTVAATETPGPVVVLALDRDFDALRDYQRLVGELRKAGIAAELYLGDGKMNAQLKYADRRRSRVAVIQGSNERSAPGGPQVTIRDLKLGAELARMTKDRADYLELRQRAQFSAPEGELVERVRQVLARG